MIIAFTGHRPDKLGGYKLPNPTYTYVCQQIESILREIKPEKVISGMALGVDQWAAFIAYKLKIPFIAAVPFLKQDAVWRLESKTAYTKLLSKAVEVVTVSEGEYSAAKLQIRNQWIVDHCDTLIAVYDNSAGGTANCIKYAKTKNRDLILINPKP